MPLTLTYKITYSANYLNFFNSNESVGNLLRKLSNKFMERHKIKGRKAKALVLLKTVKGARKTINPNRSATQRQTDGVVVQRRFEK